MPESEPGAQSANVSILIPTTNPAHFLDESLHSIRAQESSASTKVIVVGNGSEDETPELLAQWMSRDRIRSLREERLGRSQAINSALAIAPGSLILCTDDDIVAQPGWVEAYVRFCAEAPGHMLFAGGPIISVASDLTAWPGWLGSDLRSAGELHHGPRLRTLGPREWLWGANMAAKAETMRALGGLDTSLGRRGEERGTYEDIDIQVRLRSAGGSVWFVPGAVIHHRVPRETVTPRRVVYGDFHRGMSSSTHMFHGADGNGEPTPALGESMAGVAWNLFWMFPAATGLRLARRRSLASFVRRKGNRVGYWLGALESRKREAPDGRLTHWLAAGWRRLAELALRLPPAR